MKINSLYLILAVIFVVVFCGLIAIFAYANSGLSSPFVSTTSSNINLEKQVIDLTSELEGIKKRNASYSYEVSSLKKELKNLSKKMKN